MLKKIAVFVFSALISTSLLAYAEAPPQPQMVGQYNVGELPHIGTLVCTADNLQVAIYGDVETLAAVVIFHNNTAIFTGIVGGNTKDHLFLVNQSENWEEITSEALVASPLMESLEKIGLCKEKMGLK